MIKKVILLLAMFLFLILIITNFKPQTKQVFNDNDITEEYEFYILNFNGLNTNNFFDYFKNDEIEIIGIYPKINNIYLEKLFDKLNYYAFSYQSDSYNLKAFFNYYLSVLDDNGFKQDYIKSKLNGINIKQVQVYSSLNKILDLINKYPDIIYK